MGRKIKVGIIGVGSIAYRHIRGFIDSPDAEIVALADTDSKQLKTAKQKVPELVDVPAYTDDKLMLKAGSMDAVVINTPHTLHYKQTMDAMDMGLHVLVEKPMVCSTKHAKDIIAKAKSTGRIVMIAYQRHYQPQYRYIKQMVDKGSLGEITSISALLCQQWKKLTAGTWRQVPEQSGGGQLNDSGSHLLDMILWTSGLSAKCVQAYIDNRNTPVDINSAVSLEFTNGAQGSVSIVGDAPCWYEDFTICGTKGIIFYRNGRLIYCNEAGEMTEPSDLPEECNIDQGFCDAILGRDQNWVPAECGLRVIEITEAAWKSAEEKAPCEVASL